MIDPDNVFADLPSASAGEAFQTLLETGAVRIERIVSHSAASPKDFWYDQAHDEWVLVLSGEAILEFNPGGMIRMGTGDHLFIPKHLKHRVEHTSPEAIWLAVHIKSEGKAVV